MRGFYIIIRAWRERVSRYIRFEESPKAENISGIYFINNILKMRVDEFLGIAFVSSIFVFSRFKDH